MLVVYTVTIFLSAILLFVVQPMFARMILPLLGGSPSVWNAAMLFYQAALLGGYAYAHFSTRRLGVRKQAVCHLVLLASVILALPFGIPSGWTPPETDPTWWLLGVMAITVGLPFFVVSSTSPVVQRWFASTGHVSASDPYFLYAASNVGSLLALLGYPFALERWIGLRDQTLLWTWGYGALVALMAGCAWFVLRGTAPGREAEAERECEVATEELGGWRRARWVALAFAPSSLMLSVTSYLSSEVASAPLLWTLPLTLYLLTFVFVFARAGWMSHEVMLRAFPISVTALTLLLTMRATNPFFLMAFVHLAVFFITAMACHGGLAMDRPSSGRLTEFYLWMSVGGALGGLFNALVAPALFDSFVEYPLVMVAACLLVMPSVKQGGARDSKLMTVTLPVSLGAVTLLCIWFVPPLFPSTSSAVHAAVFGPPVLLGYFLSEHRVRFAAGVAAVFLASGLYIGETGRTLFSDRSFYGAHRVTESPDGRFRLLVHGTTVHGMQRVENEDLPMPLSYYFPTGPAGEYFSRFRRQLKGPVGVIGMGAGSLASYGRKGQEWTFFEIDPVVADLAGDSGYFSYLTRSPAEINVVLGDGRLSLSQEPDGRFQLLVVDAFSSDVIPMHLLTREAFAIYSSKLREDGMILFHISNRHFDLRQKLTDLALDAGLICYYREGRGFGAVERRAGRDPSEWMLMARRQRDLRPIARSLEWIPMTEPSGAEPWTDDRSSLLDVIFQD